MNLLETWQQARVNLVVRLYLTLLGIAPSSHYQMVWRYPANFGAAVEEWKLTPDQRLVPTRDARIPDPQPRGSFGAGLLSGAGKAHALIDDDLSPGPDGREQTTEDNQALGIYEAILAFLRKLMYVAGGSSASSSFFEGNEGAVATTATFTRVSISELTFADPLLPAPGRQVFDQKFEKFEKPKNHDGPGFLFPFFKTTVQQIVTKDEPPGRQNHLTSQLFADGSWEPLGVFPLEEQLAP